MKQKGFAFYLISYCMSICCFAKINNFKCYIIQLTACCANLGISHSFSHNRSNITFALKLRCLLFWTGSSYNPNCSEQWTHSEKFNSLFILRDSKVYIECMKLYSHDLEDLPFFRNAKLGRDDLW